MEKRQQMALAAVGAVVALIYLMRKQPQATGGGLPAAMSSAASASTKPAPIIVTVGNTKPQAVADAGPVANPAPANVPPPQPVGSGSGAVFGAGGSSSGFTGIKDGRRYYSDGSSAALTENELDLYNRGILGTHYGAYTTAPGAAPAPAPASGGGAVWGAG